MVWTVDFVQSNRLLPRHLCKVLDEEGSNVFTAEMLDRVAGTLAGFDAKAGKSPFVIFFEPPSRDQRIVNQFALFSIVIRSFTAGSLFPPGKVGDA